MSHRKRTRKNTKLSIAEYEVVTECPVLLEDDGSYSDNTPVRYFLSVRLSDNRTARIPIESNTAKQIDEWEYIGGVIAPIVNRHFGTRINSADW